MNIGQLMLGIGYDLVIWPLEDKTVCVLKGAEAVASGPLAAAQDARLQVLIKDKPLERSKDILRRICDRKT